MVDLLSPRAGLRWDVWPNEEAGILYDCRSGDVLLIDLAAICILSELDSAGDGFRETSLLASCGHRCDRVTEAGLRAALRELRSLGFVGGADPGRS